MRLKPHQLEALRTKSGHGKTLNGLIRLGLLREETKIELGKFDGKTRYVTLHYTQTGTACLKNGGTLNPRHIPAREVAKRLTPAQKNAIRNWDDVIYGRLTIPTALWNSLCHYGLTYTTNRGNARLTEVGGNVRKELK